MSGDDPAIRFNQRIETCGMTRSGKSTFDRYLFVNMACRRVLVDVKGEFRVGGTRRIDLTPTNEDWRQPVAARRQLDRIDWKQPIIHLHPPWLNKPVACALYERIMEIPGDLLVWTTESYGVSSASWAPPALRQLQTTGDGQGKGHIAEMQRPANVEMTLRTEADHVFLFPPLTDDDLIAALEGVPFLKPDQARELFGALPEHGYLWADRRRKKVSIGPPLPAELRAWRTDVVSEPVRR